MTIPGTKPKPTKLKLLEGNPGKRPLNLYEPKPDPTIPECPDWLLDEAKEEWSRLSIELASLGMLTKIDMAAFAGYCQSYAKWKKAEEFIKKHGFTYQIVKRDKKNKIESIYIAPFPQVAVAHKSLNQIKAFAAEFGLTPSSRGRISLPSESLDDEFEKLLD